MNIKKFKKKIVKGNVAVELKSKEEYNKLMKICDELEIKWLSRR